MLGRRRSNGHAAPNFTCAFRVESHRIQVTVWHTEKTWAKNHQKTGYYGDKLTALCSFHRIKNRAATALRDPARGRLRRSMSPTARLSTDWRRSAMGLARIKQAARASKARCDKAYRGSGVATMTKTGLSRQKKQASVVGNQKAQSNAELGRVFALLLPNTLRPAGASDVAQTVRAAGNVGLSNTISA